MRKLLERARAAGPARWRAWFVRHRQVVRRSLVIAITTIALLATVGGTIRLVSSRGGASPSPTADSDVLRESWTAATGSGPVTGSVARDGFLYVTNGDGLVVYPEPCTPTQGTCVPLWRANVDDGPLSPPVADGGRVFAGSPSGRVYAFPGRCDTTTCSPEWVGMAGQGNVQTPAVNADFVYAVSDRLTVFPTACGSGEDDRLCTPAWTAQVPGGPAEGPPAVDGGFVAVGSGSVVGGIFTFPAICSQRCDPLWHGSTEGPVSGVTASGGTAYAVARGLLLAFPLSCTDPCPVRWRGTVVMGRPLAPGSRAAPVREEDLVYVTTTAGTLQVFPSGCPFSVCSARDRFTIGTLPLGEPAIEEGLVLVTNPSGAIFGLDTACELPDGCLPERWGRLPGAHGTPTLSRGTAYLGDVDGTIHAFAIPDTDATTDEGGGE